MHDMNQTNINLIKEFVNMKLGGVFPEKVIFVGQSLGSAQAVYSLD